MKNTKTVKTQKAVKSVKAVKNGKSQAPVKQFKATRRDKIDREAAKAAAIDIEQTLGLIAADVKEALKAVQSKKFLDATATLSRVEDNTDYCLGELEVIDA